MAKVSTVTAGSTTLGVAVGPRQFIADQLLAKADVIRAMHERVQLCQDQTEFALQRVSRINHILLVHGHTILQEKRAAEIYDGVGQRSPESSSQDSRRTAWYRPRSAQASPCKRARGSGTPGALIAATPRIQAMIQDAVTAGVLLLEARLDAVIATATSTYLEALDDEDRITAKLYVQKAAPAADETWQQTVDGHTGPVVTNPTVSELEHPSSASQDDDSDGMDFSAPRKSRLSAPQLQAQLSRLSDRTRFRRLKNTLLSKGAWQQVTRIEDLCHTHVSHKWLHHLDSSAGSVLTPQDYITNGQKRLGDRAWTHSWNTESHTRTPPMRSRRLGWRNSQTQALQPNPEGSQQRNPSRLIFSLPCPRTQRGSGCVCGLPQRSSETHRKRRLITNCLTTGMKSRICVTLSFTNVPLSGQRMGDRTLPSLEHCGTQRTSLPVEMASRCRRNRFNADGNKKFKLLFSAGEQP